MTVPSNTSFADPALQRFAEQVRSEFKRLEAPPFLDGVLVDVPMLAAPGTFDVNHGLGRMPRGWQLLYVERAPSTSSDLSIYRRQGERWDNKTLRLYSTSDFEFLRLWVF